MDRPNFVQKTIALTSDKGGFDKVIRTFSYVSKLFLHFYGNKGSTLVTSLENMSSAISDMRYALRLPGVFSTVDSVMTQNTEDSFVRKLRYFQDFVMMLYHPADVGYFLSSKQILPFFNEQQRDQMSKFATRCWLIYIVCDLIIDSYELYQLSNRINDVKKQYMRSGEKELQSTIQSLLAERRRYFFNYAINFSNLPMALEWSTDGFLPDIGIPIFGTVGSFLGLYRKWTSITRV
eukprot:gene6903-11065_t